MKKKILDSSRVIILLIITFAFCYISTMTVKAENRNTHDILLGAVDYDREQSEGSVLKENIDNKGNSAVITEEDGRVAWKFSVNAKETYYIKVGYYTIPGESLEMERRMLIDGEEAINSTLTFSRSYSQKGKAKYDLQGNEIRADEKENVCWQEVYLQDWTGYNEEAYAFELSQGEHTLILDSILDRMAIGYIILTPEKPEIASYDTVLQRYKDAKATNMKLKRIQAENYKAKSDASILIKNDRSSAGTQPSSADVIIYNTIGGSSWSDVGQWIEWEIEVPETGWYQLGMRFRQSAKIGGMSSRSLSIDGMIPFQEVSKVSFAYDNSWQTDYFGGDKPYQFYLTKGTHTIRMTVNLGELSQALSQLSELIDKLNEMYMQIIMVSGTSPDLKRDYDFASQIPEVIKQYQTVAEEIAELIAQIDKITNGQQNTAELEEMRDLLKRLYEEPETTAKRLNDFSSNISSLASWLSESRSQPLEIDYLFVAEPEAKLPKESVGFFKNVMFQLKQLFASYHMDYTSIGNTDPTSNEKDALQVWVIAGTEQAQVIQKLINENFIPNSSISVKMQNVTKDALMPAIFAGRGPDVVLNLDEATPVNYALRGVVMNLNEFEDIDEVLEQYDECSYEAFKSEDGLYALPTTLDYPILFYRKDVIEEMEIDVEDCETWETMLQVVLPKLQMKNLKFGLTPSLSSYLMFYYQGGNQLYSEDDMEILLDTKESINSFTKYSSIYTDYKQDMTFNFVNLFRSGEMPIAVVPYSQYYQLAVFAPEIDGKWGVMPVPGTRNEDGEVNHAVACTVTGASILSATDKKEEAWKFLKWWAGDEIQSDYAREVETVLGIAGRVNPASNVARDSISWTKEVKAILNNQLEYCQGVPQVAGSYYVNRYFDFAFRDVVYDGDDIVQTLISVTEDINTEIKEKTMELKSNK